MALSDTKLRSLKPADKSFSESDGGGLYIEILQTGKKRWGLKYRTSAGKQETIRLGDYPAYSLAEARTWRDDCKALAGRGLSPMALKRGDPIPEDVPMAAKELAQFFLRNWCVKAIEKAKTKADEQQASDTVEAFALRWFEEVVIPNNSNALA